MALPSRYMKVQQDLTTGLVTITFFPCRHQHTYDHAEGTAHLRSQRELQEFREIHSICWDCHVALEAPDA